VWAITLNPPPGFGYDFGAVKFSADEVKNGAGAAKSGSGGGTADAAVGELLADCFWGCDDWQCSLPLSSFPTPTPSVSPPLTPLTHPGDGDVDVVNVRRSAKADCPVNASCAASPPPASTP
jgi:hypothetical protein